jgi:activator of 2-hydroxyglutaryl-CoA dehydratase
MTSSNVPQIQDTVKILRETQKILSAPGAWIQNVYALDKQKQEVETNDGAACSFCAVGACLASQNRTAECYEDYTDGPGTAIHYLDITMGGVKQKGHAAVDATFGNDSTSTTLNHVLMALDFAILMATDELCLS